jgi:hypothetical protein
LDIEQTYNFFFYLFISTGIFAGIINLIYEDTYMLFSSSGELPPVGSGIGVGGVNIGNSAVGQANPSAVNP